MNKLNKLLPLALSVVVLASCGTGPTGPSDGYEPIPGNQIVGPNHAYAKYFEGMEYKSEYNALTPQAISKELNYLKYSDGSVARHWANFVDGLLLQNEFGILTKQLALEAHQENNSIFTFKIRPNVPWVTYNGFQYEAIINGKKVKQWVNAHDFVTSAKEVLKFENASQTQYLITNFIEGAMEYYQLSYIDYQIRHVPDWAEEFKGDNDAIAAKLNELMYENTGERTNIQGEELKSIRRFEKVKIEVVEEPASNGGGTIRYTLRKPAFYFPTLLTYSCYLPMNEYFLDEIKFPSLGKKNDKLLYCGPYLLEKSNEKFITYRKNPLYWNADEVFIHKINYEILLEGDASLRRQLYEDGDIDGFGLTLDDGEGWEKYVTGPDGTGTIHDPFSPDVNTRDYDYIDFVHGIHLNVGRIRNDEVHYRDDNKSYAQNPDGADREGGKEHIENADKAMSLDAVRKLLLKGLNIAQYNKMFKLTPDLEGQYAMNSYVPKGFVQDEHGNDYTTTHYYDAYADWYEKENPGEPRLTREQVGAIIGQGQYEGVNKKYEWDEDGNVTTDELAELRADALKAIELYNVAHPEDKITFPVQFEYFSAWTIPEVKGLDTELLLDYNRRLNNMPKVNDFSRKTPNLKFFVIPTYDINKDNSEMVSNAGNFDISTQWGWGPDYGDPMSYMNTFAKKGDWANIFKYINLDYCASYKLNANKTALEKYDLLADYTKIVKDADDTTSSTNERFQKFAKAESLLLNEMAIYQPLHMMGQGRNLSVSKAAGYLTPTGSYGLAKDRQDKLIVLTASLKRGDSLNPLAESNKGTRTYCTAKYEQLKAEYLSNLDSNMDIY